MLTALLLGCGPGAGAPDDVSPDVDTAAPAVLPTFQGSVPRNLLVLSVDTMRRDHMSRYSDDKTLTPFLDSLALTGFVLDDHTSCSNWTVAGTTCALAGASNLDRAEARGMFPILGQTVLQALPGNGDPNGPTPLLPRWLSDADYSTTLVTSNGFFSRAWGNTQGYQHVSFPGFSPVPQIWAKAQELIDGDVPLGDPWLLHLHFFEPHSPYTPTEAYAEAMKTLPPIPLDVSTRDGQDEARETIRLDPPVLTEAEIEGVKEHLRFLYAGEVRRFDQGLADMWGELDARGLLDDTLVVFWTDHGEAFWEQNVAQHARLLHPNENDALALFWAKNIEPGAWKGPTTHADLTPTILTLLQRPIPEEVSGIPVGLAPPDRARFSLADGYAGPVQAVRRGTDLLHFRWRHPADILVGLYDLSVDPQAENNLYRPDEPVADRWLPLWDLLRPKILQAEPFIAQDPRGYQLLWPDNLPTDG